MGKKNEYSVDIARTVTTVMSIVVEADNASEANEKAMEKASNEDFSNGSECDPEYSYTGSVEKLT